MKSHRGVVCCFCALSGDICILTASGSRLTEAMTASCTVSAKKRGELPRSFACCLEHTVLCCVARPTAEKFHPHPKPTTPYFASSECGLEQGILLFLTNFSERVVINYYYTCYPAMMILIPVEQSPPIQALVFRFSLGFLLSGNG